MSSTSTPYHRRVGDHSISGRKLRVAARGLDISALKVNPAPVLIATEGARSGSVKAHGFLPGTVIVSDNAGQFDVDLHALPAARTAP